MVVDGLINNPLGLAGIKNEKGSIARAINGILWARRAPILGAKGSSGASFRMRQARMLQGSRVRRWISVMEKLRGLMATGGAGAGCGSGCSSPAGLPIQAAVSRNVRLRVRAS